MGKEVKTQIDLLADYIMDEVPGEPSASEGAGDTAIRLLKAVYGLRAAEEPIKMSVWVDVGIQSSQAFPPIIWTTYPGFHPGNGLTRYQINFEVPEMEKLIDRTVEAEAVPMEVL